MARLIYSALFYVMMPFVLLRLWRRGKVSPAYRQRISERFGFFAAFKSEKPVVWFHTVSVGEFIGAQPLIKHLLARSDISLVVTTTTPTGSERVRAVFGEQVFHVYSPYDTPDAVARFLTRTQPQLMLTMETELWPNVLAACAARKIPTLLINGRLSEKSARGYQKFSRLTRPMLESLSAAAIQNREDAARFSALGLADHKQIVTGNIKFDLTLDEQVIAKAQHLKNQINAKTTRAVFIAASTHAGEDEIILDAFIRLKKLDPQLLLILVPRHPERFDRVAEQCAQTQLNVVRRSSQQDLSECDILVGDTMGELLALYGASDIAFVGGSLVANGGHNFIEAAVWGLPLLSGPHVFNFAEVARLLNSSGALLTVQDAEQLAKNVGELLEHPARAIALGQAASAVAEANRGALTKTQAFVDKYLP